MKNQIMSLIISVLVVILLSGILVYLLLNQNQGDIGIGESQVESSPGIIIKSLDISDINTVTINNSNGTFTLINLGSSFSVEGYEGVNTSIKNIKLVTDALTNLKATSVIWEPTSSEELTIGNSEVLENEYLWQYGFNAPESRITFTTVSQEKFDLILGKEAPSSYGRYGAYDGRVYLFDNSAMSIFLKGKNSFIDNQITQSKPLSYDSGKVVLSGSVRALPITIDINPAPKEATEETEDTIPSGLKKYSYMISTPAERKLPAETAEALIDGIFSVYANWIEKIKPTPEDMVSYGLSVPYSILEINLDGEGFTLLASKPDESGNVYIMRENSPVIYTVFGDRLNWLTTQYELLTKSVYTPADIKEVKSLTVTGQKSYYNYVLSRTGDSISNVTCNGKEFDQTLFESLYNIITPIPPTKYTEGIPSLNPVFTMTIEYIDKERESDIILLSPTGDGDLYLTINGKTNYTTGEEFAKTILTNCENALYGKELSKLPI